MTAKSSEIQSHDEEADLLRLRQAQELLEMMEAEGLFERAERLNQDGVLETVWMLTDKDKEPLGQLEAQ